MNGEEFKSRVEYDSEMKGSLSKKVEARLGGTTFTFGDDNFRALRALAGEISPTASLKKT